MQFADEIKKILQNAGVKGEIELTTPPNPEMGDLSFACFNIAREWRIGPKEAAEQIKAKAGGKKSKLVEKMEVAGPYVNFYLKTSELAKIVLDKIKKQGGKYGRAEKKQKEKVMVEYSQPNTHKEFHVGHFRNVCIGSTLVNLFRAAGFKTVSANYIGDIGAHVAKCLWYIKKYDKIAPKTHKGKWLGRMYAEASRIAEENPNYKNEIQEVQQKLEAGNKEWVKLWKETKQWSLEEFKKIYDLLGVKFDAWFYESEVEKPGKDMVARLLKSGVAKKGEGGAIIVDLNEYGLDIFLVLKSDGTTLYATKDLALAKKKFDEYKIDKSIVVVDSRQAFYFKQLFKTLELAGWKKDLKCLAYEFVKLPEGAMASRTGNVILFEDLYNDVFVSALEEIKTRHAAWELKTMEKAASRIALSALKFDMLKHATDRVVVFDKKMALSFDGFTGPYVLYAVARINSILKKAKIKKGDFALLVQPEEKRLLLSLAKYGEVAQDALKNYNPSAITRYCFDLAQQFNDFYNKHSVLNAENKGLIGARLQLSAAVKNVLKNALGLLTIDTVEEM